MLSYRHAFHAGNHADLLKHTLLCLLLKKLANKRTPFVYMDTHAGAGLYDLSDGQAQQTGEFLQGVERLLRRDDLPPAMADFIGLLRGFRQANPFGYPGSPAIAQQLLRPQDRLVLMELHNNEVEVLKRNCGGDTRIRFHHRNGFEGLAALTPPEFPRGVALVDPAYEVKTDYDRAPSSIGRAQKRWNTGIFALWYPLLSPTRDRSAQLLEQLRRTTKGKLLIAELWVKAPGETFGMHGSGMAVLNPPWQLDEQMRGILPGLADVLAQDENAGWRVDWARGGEDAS